MPLPSLQLRGKRVLVMGLGLHGGGLGITRWMVAQGAAVTVTDLKSAHELRPSVEALAGLPVRFALGGHNEADFRDTDLVLRNPGVPAESPYLKIARAHGIPVEMEMGLFFRLCPAPIIGITGTKGKTTTTSLTGEILRRSRPDTVVAGNIAGGSPQWHGVLPAVELLPRIGPDTPVVLELSSWQLEGLPENTCPHIAAVTNISADHLNRYASMAAYAASKKAIFAHQRADDTVVLNYDNPFTRAFAAEAPGRVAWFSRRQPVEGAFLDGSLIRWRLQGREAVLASADDIRMPGAHSVENVLAAAAIAMVWGAAPEAIREGIRGFGGVPHRLELVGEAGGVRYYNDTTATTPDATVAALAAFPEGTGIVAIAGGSDKGLDFAEAAKSLAARTKAVVLLAGKGTDRLMPAIRAEGGAVTGPFQSMAEAVEAARDAASPGDVVLLSPACASFGMFANEFERGNRFRQIVADLTRERGLAAR